MTRRLPLDGILVADFTRVLAGPLCTQMLADEGARVIKVEEPSRGDETRRWGPPFAAEISTYLLSVNRNKESLALDLRSEEGKRIASELIARADVVIDNFLPPQREALLDVPESKIHCSIGGFDADTKEANTPGYDLLAQAGAGLMSITGEADGEPTKIGVALADVLTAHYAHGAILAALVARERTKKGQRIEVSLFGATLASLVNVAQGALVTNEEARRYGNAHPSIVPYQLFHARDRAFALGGGTDRHFRSLCERVIERPALAQDERFATNGGRVQHRGTLVPLLEEIFRTRDAEHWLARCRDAAIPASAVRGVLEALRSEEAKPLIATIEHPVIGTYEAVRHPVRFDGERLPIRNAPPALGEHTQKLMRELGAVRQDEQQNAAEHEKRDQAEDESDVL
ncbi:MAG: CoA transferase [Acidobacteriota bacterium]|nr:CoA transferase [Acidobacteriota bacterium]